MINSSNVLGSLSEEKIFGIVGTVNLTHYILMSVLFWKTGCAKTLEPKVRQREHVDILPEASLGLA